MTSHVTLSCCGRWFALAGSVAASGRSSVCIMCYCREAQGRINTKLGLMLLPRQGPVFFSAFKTDQDPCDATTLYWMRLHETWYSSMVQFEINIKLSTINGKGLNRLIVRKETRNSAIERDRAAGCGLRYNVGPMLFILGSLESP